MSSEFGDLRMGENRMHGDSAWGLASYYIQSINGVDSVLENPDPHLQLELVIAKRISCTSLDSNSRWCIAN